jgi:hypothetical protein
VPGARGPLGRAWAQHRSGRASVPMVEASRVILSPPSVLSAIAGDLASHPILAERVMRALHGKGGHGRRRQAASFSPTSDDGLLPVSHLRLTNRGTLVAWRSSGHSGRSCQDRHELETRSSVTHRWMRAMVIDMHSNQVPAQSLHRSQCGSFGQLAMFHGVRLCAPRQWYASCATAVHRAPDH